MTRDPINPLIKVLLVLGREIWYHIGHMMKQNKMSLKRSTAA